MRPLTRVLLGVLVWQVSAWAAGDNTVTNGGFEDQAKDWSLSAEAALSTDKPHTGAACLQVARTDKAAYTLTTQPLKLQPNRPYEIAAWVRTEKLTEGQAGGATICMEWTKAGSFHGGEYPKGIWGTRDWTLVKAVAKVPADADPLVRLVCYLRRDSVGTAWFDDVSVRLVTDYPPVDKVFTHAYRNSSVGEPVRVGATLDLDWAGLKAETAPVRLQVRDGAGRTLATLKPTQVDDKLAEFSVDASTLEPGEYALACGIEAPGGKLTAERICTFKRLTEHAPRYAYIDDHQRLIVDGKPFFPLGTYWNTHYHLDSHTPEQRQAIYAKYPSSRDRTLLDLYGKSPFNCLMPYDSWNWQEADLDYLATLNLKIIFSVKDSFYGTCDAYKLKSADEERSALEREVKRVGGHPTLIAWYTNDEVAPDDPRLLKHQQWMEELDPGRPTWGVSYHSHADYVGTCDVYGMDCYPVPSTAPGAVLKQARAAGEGAGASRALWHVPQISDTGTYGKDITASRPPTLPEMRAMAWMCIAAGANGLVFYSFFDLIRAEDVEPFAPRWAEITTMAQEIKDLEPMLLSVDPAPQPEPVNDADGAVAWRLYAHEGKTYLVTVNSTTEPKTASFGFPKAFSAAENIMGKSSATRNGSRLELSYEPLEVKIVRLTP
jgi:hypothetical protein